MHKEIYSSAEQKIAYSSNVNWKELLRWQLSSSQTGMTLLGLTMKRFKQTQNQHMEVSFFSPFLLKTSPALLLIHIFFLHAFLVPKQIQKPAASKLTFRIMSKRETEVKQLKMNNFPIPAIAGSGSPYSHGEWTRDQFASNSLPLQTGFSFFPGNRLNITEAEHIWASWIQLLHAHVPVARPQPSRTEETMTAGWKLGILYQDQPVSHYPLPK